MADYSLEQYQYSQHLKLYNDEGRENIGASDVWTVEEDHYWDNRGTTLGLYTVDLTTAHPSPEVQLCSFKNGNVIKYSVTSYDEMPGYYAYRVSFRIRYYDNNGSELRTVNLDNMYFNKQFNPNPHEVQFLYSPPMLYYQLQVQDTPTGFFSGGGIFTVARKPVLPMDMPDLHNSLVKVNGVGGALEWYDLYGIQLGYDTFDAFMDTLGKDPTPKKPEDDTSKPPEEKPDPDYDDPSDPIPDPDLPIGGDAISTGFIRVYAPTTAQLNALAGKLWDTDPGSFQQIIAKIQNDPMEAIISLHSIPYSIVGSSASCVIGNYDSGISMPTVTKQWYKISLGSLYLPEKWGSALDYSPYNTIDIFLPYIGVRSMQVDDVVGKTISVSYNTDVLSGATVASIMCGNSVLYSYNTVLTNEIPITQSSYGPMYSNILNGIGNVLSGYGSAGSPGAAAATVGSAINVAISKQHSVSRGGSIGGTYGCMGHFYPYLIIHRPIQSLASGFKHFKGYPSNITTSLGSISGYTEIESIHLDGIKCTEAERDEIRALLYNGVIF